MRLEGIHSRLLIERPAAGVVVIRLAGWDVGEFGDVPLRELDRQVEAQSGALELYIDARAARAASIDVSNEWAQWLKGNRDRLSAVSMLAGSPFVQLTARFVQRFAALGEGMRLYTDPVAFDDALRQSVAAHR